MQLAPEPTIALPAPRSRVSQFLNFGWGTILIGAIAMAATYPGRTHGLGMVIEPLLADLQLQSDDGRVMYASLDLWGTLIGALFCLPAGRLLDRFDRRWILGGNLVLFGAAVFWMSTITTWPELLVGVILTRGLGQAALSVVSLTVVAKAFNAKQIGMAMAYYAIFATPVYIGLTKSVKWAFTEPAYDWRTVWGTIGIVLMALSCMAFFIRSKPSDSSEAAPDPTAETGATLWQALATPAFWLFTLTISVWGMISSGVALFNVDIFRERGFDYALYLDVVAFVAVVGLGAKLFFGWLVNYVSLTRLLAACLVITAASLCGLPFATEEWHAYAYGFGLGIAGGAVALLFFATWGRLYGRRDLGRIQGVAQMFTVFASAAGPLVFSLGKRATTSYALVFLGLAGIVMLMAIAAWFTPLPRLVESTKAVEGN